MRTNKELQRENEQLRLRLKKCMVWRREVRRLNKAIEFYALKLKCHKNYEQNELQKLKKTVDFRPPWAPDLEADCDLISPTGWWEKGAVASLTPPDNVSETTIDAPQSEVQDRPIWQQYPQLKE